MQIDKQASFLQAAISGTHSLGGERPSLPLSHTHTPSLSLTHSPSLSHTHSETLSRRHQPVGGAEGARLARARLLPGAPQPRLSMVLTINSLTPSSAASASLKKKNVPTPPSPVHYRTHMYRMAIRIYTRLWRAAGSCRGGRRRASRSRAPATRCPPPPLGIQPSVG